MKNRRIWLVLAFCATCLAPLSAQAATIEIYNQETPAGAAGPHYGTYDVCVFAHRPTIHLRSELIARVSVKPGETKRVDVGSSGKFHLTYSRGGCEKVTGGYLGDNQMQGESAGWPRTGSRYQWLNWTWTVDYHYNPGRVVLKTFTQLGTPRDE